MGIPVRALSQRTGTDPKPTKDEKQIFSWTTKDAKIKSWILSTVEPHLILNLKPYKTTKDMWAYLKKIYYKKKPPHSSINWNLRLLNILKEPSPSRIIIQGFLTCGLNMMKLSMPMSLMQLFLKYRKFRNSVTGTNFSLNYDQKMKLSNLVSWVGFLLHP